ncbi:MAG: LysE family transporter [Clostridiales bacterium]|nr:LysE family transporter [Clostridiales bacterium]
MTMDVYLSFVAYACAATVLPGPNNVLLLASAGQLGFRRCVRLLLGIWSGLVAVMLLAGGFCSVLGTLIPAIAPVFKYVGAAYILYLAFKTCRRSPVKVTDPEDEHPLTFWHGFFLQFLNVKVIMLGLASYPGYFLPYGQGVGIVVLFAVTMTACCGCGNLIWAAAGSLICPLYNRYYKIVNWIMALLLVYCALKIIFM